jgi:hypothetical protein
LGITASVHVLFEVWGGGMPSLTNSLSIVPDEVGSLIRGLVIRLRVRGLDLLGKGFECRVRALIVGN